MLLPLFHLLSALIYAFVYYYEQNYLAIPYPKEYNHYTWKGRFVFLTVWCLFLQNVYYPTALLNDIIGTNAYMPKKTPLIRKFKDLLYSLLYPVSTYVALSFWIVYLIDKDKVFPPAIEAAIPVWVNHIMHTMIVVTANLEMLLSNITYLSRKAGVTVSTGFNIAHIVWIHNVYFATGVWVYPLLYAFNWPQKIALMVASLGFSAGLYFLGENINCQVSNKGKPAKSKNR